jgi:tryptophan synthase alpha chain
MAASASRALRAAPRAPRASRARRNPERGAASRAVATRASVSEAFKAVLDDGKRAFIPFICAGDPDLESTKKALKILDDAGADVIELGVPYSDPLADGPVIQAAATRALENGATLNKVIDLVREMTPQIKAPIVMFTYYNPIYQRGVDKFCADIAAAGAKGLLVPDIPLEETYDVSEIASKHGIELVLLSTPTTPVERAKKIAQATKGFVYLVSVTGVTGVQSNVATRVEQLVEELRSVTDKPIAVGFGVSEAKHAKQIVDWGADGVIVGSALVRALGEAKTPEEGLAALKAKAEEIRGGATR